MLKTFSGAITVLQCTVVSIPHRYAENFIASLRSAVNLPAFQSLIGMLKTNNYMEAETLVNLGFNPS